MNVRKNAENISAKERDAFIQAVLKMKHEGNPKTGRTYDTYVQFHQATIFNHLTPSASQVDIKNQYGFNSFAHSCPSFLPWHRALLYLFEKDLQQISGDPTLTIPFWDSTNGLDAKSKVFKSNFLGGNGIKSKGWKVQDGPFGEEAGNWPLRIKTIASTIENPIDRDGHMRRAFGVYPAHPILPLTILERINPAQKEYDEKNKKKKMVVLPDADAIAAAFHIATYDKAPWNGTGPSATGFRFRIEGLHGVPHLWAGGEGIGSIADLSTSPNDPLFFLHHANVDRWFAKWQAKNPHTAYPVDEPIVGNIGQANTALMLPFGRPVSDFWSTTALGYTYSTNASV